jgi:uncharacterized membrane protein
MSKSKKHEYEAKKAAVLHTKKAKINSMSMVLSAAIVFVAVAAAAYYATGTPASQPETVSSANTDTAHISYPVSMFADGAARHFDFKADGLTIRYFILKSSDGVIRAAFDACDVCWPAGKGYYQDGDEMVCRNCGRRFASILVNEVQGGCNPAPLNRSVKDDQLILKVGDILRGKSYFDFKEKV